MSQLPSLLYLFTDTIAWECQATSWQCCFEQQEEWHRTFGWLMHVRVLSGKEVKNTLCRWCRERDMSPLTMSIRGEMESWFAFRCRIIWMSNWHARRRALRNVATTFAYLLLQFCPQFLPFLLLQYTQNLILICVYSPVTQQDVTCVVPQADNSMEGRFWNSNGRPASCHEYQNYSVVHVEKVLVCLRSWKSQQESEILKFLPEPRPEHLDPIAWSYVCIGVVVSDFWLQRSIVITWHTKLLLDASRLCWQID